MSSEAERLKRILLSQAVPEPNSGCLLWEGKDNGVYATYSTPLFRTKLVHRIMYRLEGRWLPDWLTLDHRCRVTFCINPDHMDVVSREENSRRRHG